MGAAVVVGGDGQLGVALARLLEARGCQVACTSRRKASAVKLELGDPTDAFFENPAIAAIMRTKHPVAYLLAARTGFAACENDPEGSRRVNVDRTVALGAAFVSKGAFVVYPSSNAVFGDFGEGASEDAERAPSSEYGRQKAEAESALLALSGAATEGGASVLRLSKVVGNKGLIADWLRALSEGRGIDAATDLVLSPLSSRAAAAGLAALAGNRRSGVYHLSGETALPYFEFARRLARRLGAGESLVRPHRVRPPGDGGLSNSGGLGMGARSLEAGLRPQPLDAAIEDVVAEFCETN